MKKILIFMFLLLCSSYSMSQLSDGTYHIVKQSSIIDGKEEFQTDKMLGTSFFFFDLKNKCISFMVSDYIVAIYDITETLTANESTLYICKDRKTGHPFKLMFKPHATIEGAGELMITQSSKWFDFFSILKNE